MLAGDELHRSLLRSIVETARAIFDAKASSIFLLDEERGRARVRGGRGRGLGQLVGKRFPAGTGIAGWVLATRQPLVLEDVQGIRASAREAAESTGYVPKGMMAVPLLHEERALGVLSVLDRAKDNALHARRDGSAGRFANQAAIGLDLLLRARRARAALEGADEALQRVARARGATWRRCRRRGGRRRSRLLAALEEIIRP